MSTAFDTVLEGYRRRLADEVTLMSDLPREQFGARRDEFLLAVGEDTARFLQATIIGLGAKRIVEVGTSYGYSTLFLAQAAQRTGGKVTTYEMSAPKQAYAREQLAQAGLAAQVEWKTGDAVKLLEQEATGVDFVLIDLWKDLYIPCFERLYPLLSPNAVVVADNMIYPEHTRAQASAYRTYVRGKPDIEAVLLPIGSGLDLCRKIDGP
jgi:predicted O-methyltransferase YrrM